MNHKIDQLKFVSQYFLAGIAYELFY